MYRIAQNDFLKDVAPERRVSELVGTVEEGETHASDTEDFESRIVHKGEVFNCCLCGVIAPEEKGYHFKQLGGDQVRALRLMSDVASEFPFVCHTCYKRKIGVTQGAIGSATYVQGILNMLLRIFVRGYCGAWVARYLLDFRGEDMIVAGAFIGSFVAFEGFPGLFFQVLRHPLVMMCIFLMPVALGAAWSMRPEVVQPLLDDPTIIFGEDTRILSLVLAQTSVKGSAAGLVLGLMLGTISPTPDDSPPPQQPQPEDSEDF
jgi:hypothetical protein